MEAAFHTSSSLAIEDDPVFSELMRLIYHGAGADVEVPFNANLESNFSYEPYSKGYDHPALNYNFVNVMPNSSKRASAFPSLTLYSDASLARSVQWSIC
jgi:hypothetical protein